MNVIGEERPVVFRSPHGTGLPILGSSFVVAVGLVALVWLFR